MLAGDPGTQWEQSGAKGDHPLYIEIWRNRVTGFLVVKRKEGLWHVLDARGTLLRKTPDRFNRDPVLWYRSRLAAIDAATYGPQRHLKRCSGCNSTANQCNRAGEGRKCCPDCSHAKTRVTNAA